MEADSTRLMIQRKSNAKRKGKPWIGYLKEQMRKRIETAFSEIKALFLRKIHAVTIEGFLLAELTLFMFATTLNRIS